MASGIIPPRCLYTIRKGESVYDNVAGRPAIASTDIIKIRSGTDGTACIFWDEKNTACRIYGHRPMECRVLECWNPAPLMNVYQINRLTREDLLQESAAVWDLVSDHQKRCDFETIRSLSDRLTSRQTPRDLSRIREIIRFDTHLRHVMATKGGMATDIMPFLLGRSLVEIIPVYLPGAGAVL